MPYPNDASIYSLDEQEPDITEKVPPVRYCPHDVPTYIQCDACSTWTLPSKTWSCRCGATISYPGVCESCSSAMLREEVIDARKSKLRDHVPARYRQCLPQDIEFLDIKAHKMSTVLQWYTGMYKAKTLLIRGDTHVRKSRLAGALLRQAIEIDGHEASFISAHELAGIAGVSQEHTARARFFASDVKRLICIDDIGAALGGAPAGSGVASQRIGPVRDIMFTRHNGKARTIYTTAMNNREIEACFGADILARLTDPVEALCVNLSSE